MLFLDVFKETFIIVSSPVYNIPFHITDKTFLFYFELPFPFFCIFCFLFVEQDCDYQTVVDHDCEECGEEFRDISDSNSTDIFNINVIFI